jgi:hypothetical protein
MVFWEEQLSELVSWTDISEAFKKKNCLLLNCPGWIFPAGESYYQVPQDLFVFDPNCVLIGYAPQVGLASGFGFDSQLPYVIVFEPFNDFFQINFVCFELPV